MASKFPTAQPEAKTDFSSSTQIASSYQNAQGEDINAIAAKVGHGAANNAPASGKLLRGTGTGTSEWDKTCPTGEIVGTTDTQTLSNKTLTTPKINTINEETDAAGVTVDGVKMKDSAIFATQPSCQVRISAAVAIANATPTDVSFNTEDWDTHSFHDNSTNPDRITIPSGLGGRYLVIFNVGWASSATGSRWILLKNQSGGVVTGTETIHDGETGAYGVYEYTETAIANLTAGEYYRFQVRQDSGGNLNLNGAIVTLYKLP